MDFALKTKGNVSQSKDRKVLKIVDIFPLGNFGIYQFTNFIIFFFLPKWKKKIHKVCLLFYYTCKEQELKIFPGNTSASHLPSINGKNQASIEAILKNL